MDENGRSRFDLLLDLLADEVSVRLEARSKPDRGEPAPPLPIPPALVETPVSREFSAPVPEPVHAAGFAQEPAEEPPKASEPEETAVALPSSASALMWRLAVGVLLAVILINVPLNMQGTALARSIPGSASLVITNGLVVKEEASPEIWVYRDGAFHWISSLDAFSQYGYRWEDVHMVQPGFLNDFDKGKPIYLLLKCPASPHVYRLEEGQKRWIVDIPTFQAEGYVWDDVKIVSCYQLAALPDGDSIPPGRGTPPPPLP